MDKEIVYVWVDINGWLLVDKEVERTTWKFIEGIATLPDGRQLYVTSDGWLAVNYEGDHTNTEDNRRRLSFDDGVFAIGDGRQLYICGKYSGWGWMGAGAEGAGYNVNKCRRTFIMEDSDQSDCKFITILKGIKEMHKFIQEYSCLG